MLLEEKGRGYFVGTGVSHLLSITHMIFVDDILIFSNGTIQDMDTLQKIIRFVFKAMMMVIKNNNSSMSIFNPIYMVTHQISKIFDYKIELIDQGLKYSGFQLKPNYYKK